MQFKRILLLNRIRIDLLRKEWDKQLDLMIMGTAKGKSKLDSQALIKINTESQVIRDYYFKCKDTHAREYIKWREVTKHIKMTRAAQTLMVLRWKANRNDKEEGEGKLEAKENKRNKKKSN